MSATIVGPNRAFAIERKPRVASAAVLILDGGTGFGDRMRRTTERHSDLHVAKVVDDADEVLRLAQHAKVDVVVIDQPARSRSGLWLCCDLKRATSPSPVMICPTYPDGALVAASIAAGADALVSKLESDAELCDAIRRVVRGERLLPRIPPRVGAMLHDRLDRTEHAIFGMLLAGLSPADVARGLRISRSELESRRSLLLGKLDT